MVILTMIMRLPGIANQAIFIYVSHGLFYAFIYFGLFITWGISIKRRIIQEQTLKFMIAIVVLMLFWFMVRTIKFIYIDDNTDIERWCWYAYYIPMILIPLMSLFVALSLGKPEDYRLPKWNALIYIPAIILIGFVLTNDFHQMVFTFPKGGPWSDQNSKYGIVYWIIFSWITSSVLASLIITMIKSRVPRSKKILWLPFIPYFIALAYAILYIMGFPFLRVIAGDMTAIFCLIIMAIFESLIQSGLVRSNVYYKELFYGSDLKAQILNKDYQLCYQTNLFPVEANHNLRTSTFPISGGHVTWLEDISEMNGLIKELEEVNQRLSEENSLLQAELELRGRKIEIDEKTKLYDKITKKIEPQLKALNNILSEGIEDTGSLQEKLVQICVLGTYIKRSGNLLILGEDSSVFSVKELEYCLRESVEAILQGGIDCTLKSNCKGKVKAEYLVLVYDLFEEIVESILPCITALFINLSISKGNVKIKLQINCDKENKLENKLDKESSKNISELIKNGGHVAMTEEDGSLAIIVELPKAGEGI